MLNVTLLARFELTLADLFAIAFYDLGRLQPTAGCRSYREGNEEKEATKGLCV